MKKRHDKNDDKDYINSYDWQYVMHCRPFATADEVLDIKQLNPWEILITFSDGERIVYDTFAGTERTVFYNDINELSDEYERREFAVMLCNMMARRFVTQEELAERVGTSQTMISRYINGQCLPSVLTVRKMAKVLRCSMDDFFYKNY